MKIQICPKCRKVCYLETKAMPPVCPECGYSFAERRKFERQEKSVNLFFFGYTPQAAKTRDVSHNGARIAYTGKPFEQNTVVNFKFEGLAAKKSAEVVWSKRINNKLSESGLRYRAKRLNY